MINNKQMTVVWHIDGFKVSYMEIFETTKFAGYLSSIHGRLTVHKGKVHDYFTMDLDYSKQVTVKLSMIKYLDSVLQEFPDHLVTTAATPEFDHLFKIRDESETQYLLEDQANTFHHKVAQLLFISASA